MWLATEPLFDLPLGTQMVFVRLREARQPLAFAPPFPEACSPFPGVSLGIVPHYKAPPQRSKREKKAACCTDVANPLHSGAANAAGSGAAVPTAATGTAAAHWWPAAGNSNNRWSLPKAKALMNLSLMQPRGVAHLRGGGGSVHQRQRRWRFGARPVPGGCLSSLCCCRRILVTC